MPETPLPDLRSVITNLGKWSMVWARDEALATKQAVWMVNLETGAAYKLGASANGIRFERVPLVEG